MRYLLVKNWREHQHYKHRSPPWIKLHRAVIEDYAFSSLKDKSKAHLMLIWVLASGTEGRIPNDATFIAKRINATESIDLEAIIAAGFLVPENGSENSEPLNGIDSGDKVSANLELQNEAKGILVFLNEKTGRNYEPVKANLDLILARMKEGSTAQDLRSVIARKVREWATNPDMAKYLRPATLFNRTKFAQYKGECVNELP